MSDRIVVFNQGRVEQVGTRGDLRDHEGNGFVPGSSSFQPAQRDGNRFTVRPEKFGCRARRPTDGMHSERGRVETSPTSE